jgi:hypothetical protein
MSSTLTLQVLPLLIHSCAIRSSRETGILTLLHSLFISHPSLCMRSAIPPPYRSPSRSETLDFSLLACTVCSLRLLLLAHFRYCFVSPSRHVSHSTLSKSWLIRGVLVLIWPLHGVLTSPDSIRSWSVIGTRTRTRLGLAHGYHLISVSSGLGILRALVRGCD